MIWLLINIVSSNSVECSRYLTLSDDSTILRLMWVKVNYSWKKKFCFINFSSYIEWVYQCWYMSIHNKKIYSKNSEGQSLKLE